MAVGEFVVGAGGAFVAHLDAPERQVLTDVVDQVVELLGGVGAGDAGPFRMGAAPVAPPDDPALRRLLPDGSKADPEVAAEFRRLTEADLRATKVTNLVRLRAAVVGAQPLLMVAPDAAPAVAAALTDLRLVLADRLGIRTDADAQALDGMLLAAYADLAAGGDDAADDAAGGDDEPDDVPDDAASSSAGRPALAHAVFVATVYQVLGLLQDSLVELMLDGLPGGDEPEQTRLSR